MSDQYNPLEFRDFGSYYSYDNELYTKQFPKEWILEMETDNTGPKFCGNCSKFGSWRGVFVAYCCNCAIDTYKGERGPGFIYNGIERCQENSIFEIGGYMEGTNFSEIGDIDFNPDDILDESQNPCVPDDLELKDGVFKYNDELFEYDEEEITTEEEYDEEDNECEGCYPLFQENQMAHCGKNGCLVDFVTNN